MRNRRQKVETTQDRAIVDPVAVAIWNEGHFSGEASSIPVIKAPRAGELSVTDAA